MDTSYCGRFFDHLLLAWCFPSPSAAHLVGPLGPRLALMQSLSVLGADSRNSFRSPCVSFWCVNQCSQGRALCPHGRLQTQVHFCHPPPPANLPAESRRFPGESPLPPPSTAWGRNRLTTSPRCVHSGLGLTSGVLDKSQDPAFVSHKTRDIQRAI